MKDIKSRTSLNEEYIRKIPQMAIYLRAGKYIPQILKIKCGLFGRGGESKNIDIFSNSLEYIGSFKGHNSYLQCLSSFYNTQIIFLASSSDKTIKLWDIQRKIIICTLHSTDYVLSLCYIREGVLLSGSAPGTLSIWELGPSASCRELTTGHISGIIGIMKINDEEVVTLEDYGDLKIWNIIQGTCIMDVSSSPKNGDDLYKIKMFDLSNTYKLACSLSYSISLWDIDGNWNEKPTEYLFDTAGCSIELISDNIFLRGGEDGQLSIIDLHTGNYLHPNISLHSFAIWEILRIAQTIVLIGSEDRSLKVIDTISRKCYFHIKDN